MSEMKPVAEIVQREPFDDESPNPCKAIIWEGSNAEDDFPAGTKLYAIPADQVLVPRELLERAANVIWQESVASTGFSSKLSEELRALLHP